MILFTHFSFLLLSSYSIEKNAKIIKAYFSFSSFVCICLCILFEYLFRLFETLKNLISKIQNLCKNSTNSTSSQEGSLNIVSPSLNTSTNKRKEKFLKKVLRNNYVNENENSSVNKNNSSELLNSNSINPGYSNPQLPDNIFEEEKGHNEEVVIIIQENRKENPETYPNYVRPLISNFTMEIPKQQRTNHPNPYLLINDMRLVRIAEYLTTRTPENREIVDNFISKGIIPDDIEDKFKE